MWTPPPDFAPLVPKSLLCRAGRPGPGARGRLSLRHLSVKSHVKSPPHLTCSERHTRLVSDTQQALGCLQNGRVHLLRDQTRRHRLTKWLSGANRTEDSGRDRPAWRPCQMPNALLPPASLVGRAWGRHTCRSLAGRPPPWLLVPSSPATTGALKGLICLFFFLFFF